MKTLEEVSELLANDQGAQNLVGILCTIALILVLLEAWRRP